MVCSEALTSKTVFQSVASGACGCLPKPLQVEDIYDVLGQLQDQAFECDDSDVIQVDHDLDDVIVGRSGDVIEAYRTAAAASTTGATVLIRGESGTGKELLARSIHDGSGRRGAFVALNCAAIVDTLAESELFGRERGAFTGATERRAGAFESADGGTLFLDEIGDAPPGFQAKLLRALDRGEFYRVGGRAPIRPDVRAVAATNQNLEGEVAEEQFRADLIYRLGEVKIHLPPPCNRLGDIPILARGLVQSISARLGYRSPKISKAALERLAKYDWPGNVTELQNVLTRVLILTRGRGVVESVLAGIERPDGDGMALVDVEKERIYRALEASGWHRGKACHILGVTRPTLRRKMQAFGLERERSGRTITD